MKLYVRILSIVLALGSVGVFADECSSMAPSRAALMGDSAAIDHMATRAISAPCVDFGALNLATALRFGYSKGKRETVDASLLMAMTLYGEMSGTDKVTSFGLALYAKQNGSCAASVLLLPIAYKAGIRDVGVFETWLKDALDMKSGTAIFADLLLRIEARNLENQSVLGLLEDYRKIRRMVTERERSFYLQNFDEMAGFDETMDEESVEEPINGSGSPVLNCKVYLGDVSKVIRTLQAARLLK